MLQVTTPTTTTPSFWPLTEITAKIRPRLSGAAAADDDQILSDAEEIAREGERLATGSPGSLWYQTYTELLRLSKPTQRLYLNARPVAAVTSVQFSDDEPIVEGTEPGEFVVYSGFLYLEDGWVAGSPGWKVTYTGGYWLASMGSSPPTELEVFVDTDGHDRRALGLRKAAFKALQTGWARDNIADPTLKRLRVSGMEREWIGGDSPIMPPSAAATFIAEGASRRMI